MKKTTSILVLFLITLGLSAQKAEWTDFDARKQMYPLSKYFSGFSMEEVDKQEDLGEVYERLKENAISNLTNTIQVTVESVTTLNKLEINDEVKENFRQNVASFSKVELAGLETRTHYDKRKKMAYALAYVKKADLINHYRKIITEKKDAIAQKIKLANNFNNMGEYDDALKAYYECMPLFAQVKDAQTMVILLEATTPELKQIADYEIQVQQAIADLYKNKQLTLDDVCNFMAFGMKMQTGAIDPGIRLTNFTFEDTKMGSQFSRRFTQHFEKELIDVAKYNVTSKAVSPSPAMKNPRYMIKGSYWNEGDKIRIMATLRDTKEGRPLASVDGFLPKQWLKDNNISWKPENFAQAHENMMQFRRDEIVNGNMNLEVWTNKGNESPIYEEDDTLQFYVRVSHPCYIRIINHFADGSRVLLVDNDYIGADKVNKVVKINQEFQCAEPFGAEVLQVNAQTQAFKPLYTEEQYGYYFIVEDLDKILANTRGFKRIKNEDMKAEKRIVVTTMAGE